MEEDTNTTKLIDGESAIARYRQTLLGVADLLDSHQWDAALNKFQELVAMEPELRLEELDADALSDVRVLLGYTREIAEQMRDGLRRELDSVSAIRSHLRSYTADSQQPQRIDREG